MYAAKGVNLLHLMKPILFNTRMVRAILYGRKTETRRIVKPQPVMDDSGMWSWKDCQWMGSGLGFPQSGVEDYAQYKPGDVLYVRETWKKRMFPDLQARYAYKADIKWLQEAMSWNPSIHMPKEAARIFLRVTDVRVERLRDMTEENALHEGCTGGIDANGGIVTAISEFEDVWDSTIKKQDLDRYGWSTNPWVWAIEFGRCEKPKEG